MTDSIIKTKSPTKIEICLVELISRGEQGLMAFEALSSYGEMSLHSTISTLANQHDINFKRVREEHPHKNSGKVVFTRYSLLSGEEIVKAKALLSYYRARRGLLSVGGCYDKANTEAK